MEFHLWKKELTPVNEWKSNIFCNAFNWHDDVKENNPLLVTNATIEA